MPQVEDSPDEALSVVEFQPNKTGLVRILPRRQDHGQTMVNDGFTMFDHGLQPWSTMVWQWYNHGLTMVNHER